MYCSPFNALHVLPVCSNNCAYSPFTATARLGSPRHQRWPDKQDGRGGTDCYLPLSGHGNKSSSDAEHAIHSVPTEKQPCQIHPLPPAERRCAVALFQQVLPVFCTHYIIVGRFCINMGSVMCCKHFFVCVCISLLCTNIHSIIFSIHIKSGRWLKEDEDSQCSAPFLLFWGEGYCGGLP